MSIEVKMFKTSEIKPYKNNPRNNDDAVNPVMESIKQFGFKVPIVIDKNNVVVAGHTRLKAAIKLKLAEVPCIVADDLTEEQINAFRLADNKVSEFATWDFELLDIELDNIAIDMTNFGFLNKNSIELDINDDDFISDTEITKNKTKKIVCPHCGKEFEM
ncbi:ParB N-terminal domain-containing protein [Thomasclavelia cocleata]|uniref:ParB N-terminal domain-containing protein n=1 Tax=Thomasclavelia cocleata TaxID=69824 RepID=UPI00242AB670|nr:ParB N-terminal domain-containing protein [Thomasclavelia cocleata]